MGQDKLHKTLLQAVVQKHGLLLNSKQCADALGWSQRKLDEARKKGVSPNYIEPTSGTTKGIMYAAQDIVDFQLKLAKNSVITGY